MTCSMRCGVLQDCSTVVNYRVADGDCEKHHLWESQAVRETGQKLFHRERGLMTDVSWEKSHSGSLLKRMAGYGVRGRWTLSENVDYTARWGKKRRPTRWRGAIREVISNRSWRWKRRSWAVTRARWRHLWYNMIKYKSLTTLWVTEIGDWRCVVASRVVSLSCLDIRCNWYWTMISFHAILIYDLDFAGGVFFDFIVNVV